MIRYVEEHEGPLLPTLQAKKFPSVSKDWKPETAAVESCRIVDQQGFYPGRLVDVEYINKHRDTLGQRLHTAGLRLAALLNKVLQP